MAVDTDKLLEASLQTRFFVALLPPTEIQTYAANVIQDLAQRYHTRTSQAPPHITLQPPFLWAQARLANLVAPLQLFASEQFAVPVSLSGFGAFAPRVLYLNVVQTPELLALQAALNDRLIQDGIISANQAQRPYVPHLTVASRKLTRTTFHQAWSELQTQPVEFQFMADRLTLLIYTGQRWHVHTEFPLNRQLEQL